jgi:hypothetical protein
MKEWFSTAREELVSLQSTPGLRTRLSIQKQNRGFSLAEVVICVGIITLVFAGIIQGNVQATKRAEWSGYSLAAQGMANQQVEQARSALWDTALYPAVNQLTNLNLIGAAYNATTKSYSGYSWANLDLPISGTNAVRATNFVTVRMINLNNTTNPPVSVQMIQVNTVWPFHRFKGMCYFTNTAATYVAQDDRSPGTF